MISNISLRLLFLSLSLLFVGTVSGWAIVEKLNGAEEDLEFLYFGATVTAVIFCVQCGIYIRMRGRVFLGLLFLATFGLSLCWFMAALFIPLLWVDIVGWETKLMMVLLLIGLIASNVAESFRIFDRKWSALEDSLRVTILKRKDGFLDWDNLILWMKFSPDLYVPFLPKSLSAFLSVIMVLSMLTGFSLRNIFPEVSVFLVGVPAAIAISYFFQQIGFNLAQARRVRALEHECKALLCQKSGEGEARKRVRKKIS